MIIIEVNFKNLIRGEATLLVASLKDPALAEQFEPGVRVLLRQTGHFEVEAEVYPEAGEIELLPQRWYGRPDWSTRRDLDGE